MASDFANALDEVTDADLYAVGSRSVDTARKFQREFSGQFGAIKAYPSYQELAADPLVDIVYIATPHSYHHDHCRMCLKAGKAVLCEKPFALDAGQARAIVELARERGLFLMEAMWTRFVPSILKLKELLSKGVIGEVQLMLAGGAYMPDYDPDVYLFKPELGGGILLDAGVYLVSMASLLFGVPTRIQATGELSQHGVDEHDAILLTHPEGQIAILYISNRAQASPDMTLLGGRGRIHVHAPIFCPPALTLKIYEKEDDEVMEFPQTGNGYAWQAREVNRCLLTGQLESDLMPLNETVQVLETMDEIRHQIGMYYPDESK